MSDTRLASLPEGPFAQLNTLLAGIEPGRAPISLTIGDPQGTVPPFVKDALDGAMAKLGTYPSIAGTEDWRAAAAGWVNRRFALDGRITPDRHVLPLAGSREGLFNALFPFMPREKAGQRPLVAMPNPFYQVYAAAALAAGAEALYVPATRANGFLPDFAGLPRETLARIAAVYVCSPSNPEGAVADEAYWTKLFALADEHDFVVLADECYADIWFEAPPPGSLSVRLKTSGGFRRLLSFHSLSKRSGLPGIRSGLVAGCAQLIERYRAFRNVAGPTVPGPLLAASAAAWNDDAHVEANRATYAKRMAAAKQVLGNAMILPAGGFFLWLDVGDGVEFTRRAWREQGVRLLPGAFLGREIDSLNGRAGDGSLLSPAGRSKEKARTNPGFSYVRVALVNDLSTIITALERVREIL